METALTEQTYLSIDGDDIGRRLEYLLLTNQVEALERFSLSFREAFNWLTEKLIEQLNARPIFFGGDNLLAVMETRPKLKVELDSLSKGFLNRSECTLSIGLGASPVQSYVALKLAKASGKNRICCYDEVHHG